ncbi:hypothetical protein FACS189487_06520 [Campylobacterota bacterium]|nr:hypothetical protein FACS189487_06520 [Campylobacterota bacterium]
MDIIAYLDKKSTVYFLSPNDDFDKSFLGGWDKSIYHRLMLPKLLPNIDRIIYCDADTIFMRRLSEADSLELGDNLIAGVKEDSKGYINSGFLVLNLKQMRKEETYKKFISVSQTEKLLYPDQDVLNLVCKNRILYLAWKFNVRVDHILHDYKFRSAKECMQAGRECVMIHFISSFKPWNGCKYPFNSYWWKYKKILDNLPL